MVSEAEKVVKIAQDGLDASYRALDLYNQVIDNVIPWKTFEDTIHELTKHEKDYSNQSGVIVGNVKTLLLNSQDEYLKATHSVFEWCSYASSLLTEYLILFERYDQRKAEVQKNILLEVLSDGLSKMEIAQESLKKSSMSFNEASGQLSALRTQLNNDFNAGSTYYAEQVNKIRQEAYLGALAGIVGGPFGLIISYSIAAGVVEGKLIPELTQRLNEVKASFDCLYHDITKADEDITSAKDKLQEEIKIIGEMKVETKKTNFWLNNSDYLIEPLKRSANKLIDQCKAYMDRHS